MESKVPPRTVGDILAAFDGRTTPFDALDVSRPLSQLKHLTEDAGQAMPAELDAEWLAFTVMPQPGDENGNGKSKWGTYYGPIGGYPTPAGFVDVPNIDDVTPGMVTYWDARARAAQHPVLRVRYADVAWDLGREQAVKVSHDMPRIVIEETIACADRRLFVNNFAAAFTALQRALSLALSLRDDVRATAVAEAMIAYEGHVAQDHLAGTWGYVFDALVTNRPTRLVMPTAATDKIVADMEARFARLIGPSEKPRTLADAGRIERAAGILAQHYQRLEQPEDVRRVLRGYGAALLDITTRVAPGVAMWWLERAFHMCRSCGLSRDAEAMALRIRKLGPEAIKEMKPFFRDVEYPPDQVERFVTAMTTGALQDVLIRIAAHFVPAEKEELGQRVKRAAEVAPLTAMIGIEKMDATGRPVARIGSVDSDLDGRIIDEASTAIEQDVPFLRWVVERMVSVLNPSAAGLCEHVMAAPIFEPARAAVIERGLKAYIDGDAVAAIHLLIPQIENAIRVMFERSGGLPFRWHRNGGWVLKNLDELLRESIVAIVLGESCVRYLRVLFTEQRGWNIRNNVFHGIMPPEYFTRVVGDRVFHALLVLALVREKSTTATPEEPLTSGEG